MGEGAEWGGGLFESATGAGFLGGVFLDGGCVMCVCLVWSCFFVEVEGLVVWSVNGCDCI